MTHHCRVLSGLVLLVVMLGLPVAPVVCELVCPQTATAVEDHGNEPRPTVAAVHAALPCHDAEAGEASAVIVSGATTVPAAGLDSWPVHRCEHPAVVSSPRAPEHVRVPQPSVVAWDTSHHLSPFQAPHAVTATLAAAGPPLPAPGAAFSPVLRI